MTTGKRLRSRLDRPLFGAAIHCRALRTPKRENGSPQECLSRQSGSSKALRRNVFQGGQGAQKPSAGASFKGVREFKSPPQERLSRGSGSSKALRRSARQGGPGTAQKPSAGVPLQGFPGRPTTTSPPRLRGGVGGGALSKTAKGRRHFHRRPFASGAFTLTGRTAPRISLSDNSHTHAGRRGRPPRRRAARPRSCSGRSGGSARRARR